MAGVAGGVSDRREAGSGGTGGGVSVSTVEEAEGEEAEAEVGLARLRNEENDLRVVNAGGFFLPCLCPLVCEGANGSEAEGWTLGCEGCSQVDTRPRAEGLRSRGSFVAR